MIELLRAVLVAPFADMAGNVTFLLEVLFGGVAAGLMYSLVALGFVLIFKATIGLNFFLEGFGEMAWGANVKKLDIGIPDTSFIVRGVQINRLELTAAVTAAVLVAVLAVLFQ